MDALVISDVSLIIKASMLVPSLALVIDVVSIYRSLRWLGINVAHQVLVIELLDVMINLNAPALQAVHIGPNRVRIAFVLVQTH